MAEASKSSSSKTTAAPAEASEASEAATPKAVTSSKIGTGEPGASGDPDVHRLLAEIESAKLNGDTARLAELNGQLADLGYKV